MTTCEICGEEFSEELFQNHIFECHGLLFCQYIGLVSKKINFTDRLVVKEVEPKKAKATKSKGKKKKDESDIQVSNQ